MFQGEIKEFNGRYGFIHCHQNGKRHFFYINDVNPSHHADIQAGAPVKFDATTDKNNKPKAINVEIVQSTGAHRKNRREHIDLKDYLSWSKDCIKPPYHFVPVPMDRNKILSITDSPTFHDGSIQDKQENKISGEILCTITALTPLIVGNDQYEAQLVQGSSSNEDKVYLPKDWNLPPVPKKKKILEPMCLKDGTVLISGSSLKGMLRQNIGALLGAPMERVGERRYTYRPNLGIHLKKNTKWISRPAVVDEVTNESVKIRLLPKMSSVSFKTPKQSDDLKCKYKTGIDGQCRLGKKFEKANPDQKKEIRDFSIVYVNKTEFDESINNTITLSQTHLKNRKKTLEILKDRTNGHLTQLHPLSDDSNFCHEVNAINQLLDNDLEKGQVIYVEIDKKTERKIASYGNHYYYRTRYADTVRLNQNGSLRISLSPLPEELQTDENGRPQLLSGARLLFGYAHDDNNNSTLNYKNDNFNKLAGRLSFNIAKEHVQDRPKENRFLRPENGHVVPLKILGAPRPSAVEFYLTQNNIKNRNDNGTLQTYGDIQNDDPPGELNGRKFYLHQPYAADHPECYETDNKETVASDKAILARYVSTPGTQFKVALRFRDLRPWELGAVLIALNPNLIDIIRNDFQEHQWPAIHSFLQKVQSILESDQNPVFANKLGHGRPLGLGSVLFKIDKLNILNDLQTLTEVENRNEYFIRMLKAFIHKLANTDAAVFDKILYRWLKIQQYRGRKRANYPNHKDTVFNFHTEVRKQHALERRSSPSAIIKNLNVLHSLPNIETLSGVEDK